MAILSLSAALLILGIPMQRTSDPIESCKFLAGTWKAEVWGGTFEETWAPPQGGTMQGMGRHIKDGKVELMEYLSIENQEGKTTMWVLLGAPSKGNPQRVPFVLSKAMPTMVTFVNEKNDFPQRITYKTVGPSEIECTLEMLDGKGERAVLKFLRTP